MPSLVFCPRCELLGDETPVLPEPAEDGQPPMAHCDRCTFVFCTGCREAYHPQRQCGEDVEASARKALKQKAECAGKSRRAQLLDELDSLALIQREARPCPKCRMPVERT